MIGVNLLIANLEKMYSEEAMRWMKMAWIKLKLPLEEEFEVEQQARYILNEDSVDELQECASTLFKSLYYQQNLTAQLFRQCAELEYKNAKLMKKKLPSKQYMKWARSLYPHEPPSAAENDIHAFMDE